MDLKDLIKKHLAERTEHFTEPWTVSETEADTKLAALMPPARFIRAVRAIPDSVIGLFRYLPLSQMAGALWSIIDCYPDASEPLKPDFPDLDRLPSAVQWSMPIPADKSQSPAAGPDGEARIDRMIYARRIETIGTILLAERLYDESRVIAALMGIESTRHQAREEDGHEAF